MAIHVIHVVDSLRSGEGGIAAAVSMMAAQSNAGLSVSAVIGRSRNPTETTEHRATLNKADVPVLSLETWLSHTAPHPHIVHQHGLWDRCIPATARRAKQHKRPVVISPHGMLTRWALKQSRIRKMCYRAALLDRALPPSISLHYTTQWEQHHSTPTFPGGPRVAGTTIIPLSLDHQRLARIANECPAPRDPSGPGNALFVGRLYPGKGVEYLIPAMEHLHATQATLTIVGDANHRLGQNLRQEATRRGLDDRIRWTGPLYPPQLYHAMANADALVLPSDHENFGLVALEAVACGTPALCSREVALGNDLVSAGVGGWVSRDPQALAADLARWLAPGHPGREALAAMRLKCPTAIAAYDHTAVGQRWHDFYSELI